MNSLTDNKGIPGIVQHANGEVGANNDIVWAGKWMSDYGIDPVDLSNDD